MGLETVDKNFKLSDDIGKDDAVFYDVTNPPFQICGLFYHDGKFRRLPEEVAKTVSENVHILHARCAGGRVRFKTDSPYVAIDAKFGRIYKVSRFALTGSSGFDLYVRKDGEERYCRTFIPGFDIQDGYTSIIEFETAEEREITINFPLYSEVCSLHIGVSDKSNIYPPRELTRKKPIVYYGSSVTQGCSASRPGTSYQNFIARRFDWDYINLGFSGSGCAEKEIAHYIKGLDMSIFVYDYDYNAPDPEYLANTHERMFKIIRDANPTLPIIMLSRPKMYLDDEEKERVKIIQKTYDNAVAAGDENVYFIPGPQLMRYTDNDGMVDHGHPNDLGFYSMGKVLGDEIEKIILKNNM